MSPQNPGGMVLARAGGSLPGHCITHHESCVLKPLALPKCGDGGTAPGSDRITGMSELTSDFDGAWKETVESYFQPLTELVLPDVAAQIDWKRGFEFLDSELRSLVPEVGSGRQHVDKLVRVVFNDGQPRWVLIHLEIQSQFDSSLPHRMFVYYYRIFDQYQLAILSVAILADPKPDGRPGVLDLRVGVRGASSITTPAGSAISRRSSSRPAPIPSPRSSSPTASPSGPQRILRHVYTTRSFGSGPCSARAFHGIKSSI